MHNWPGECRASLIERATGIEPASEAWEASILPMNYAPPTSHQRSDSPNHSRTRRERPRQHGATGHKEYKNHEQEYEGPRIVQLSPLHERGHKHGGACRGSAKHYLLSAFSNTDAPVTDGLLEARIPTTHAHRPPPQDTPQTGPPHTHRPLPQDTPQTDPAEHLSEWPNTTPPYHRELDSSTRFIFLD